MRLLVVRHAIAAPRETFGGSDGARPLTDDGRKRMRRGARALCKLVPELGLIATSPLVRAVETAAILADAYGGIETVETPALVPGAAPSDLAAWVASRADRDALAIVGHEPDLSTAVTWFSTGLEQSCVELGKGGAALLDFPGAVAGGRALLVWLLRPGQLRKLA